MGRPSSHFIYNIPSTRCFICSSNFSSPFDYLKKTSVKNESSWANVRHVRFVLPTLTTGEQCYKARQSL
jgi:hypothetical protein